MDPNECLRRMRRWAERITETGDTPEHDTPETVSIMADMAMDLADCVQALDSWIKRGGVNEVDPG